MGNDQDRDFLRAIEKAIREVQDLPDREKELIYEASEPKNSSHLNEDYYFG
jgi:hypothetical protein